ncbi:MAG: hypothetical protein ACTSWL_03585 [Promethearchaeota archaeon]
MSELVLKSQINSIDNKDYRITFHVPKNQTQLFLYAISDRNSVRSNLQGILSIIGNQFHDEFPESFNSNLVEIEKYQSFSSNLDKILSDERFTPIDRVKNYLF